MSRFRSFLAVQAGVLMVAGLVVGLAGSAQAASFGFTHRTVLMAGSKSKGKQSNTPEVPYAILFPLAIGGMAAVMYGRRKRQAPTE